ncbi:MAG: type I-C CRISPR-associated protein Cas8c/Csd1 [Treponema sp.]|nr:type I-C CRISPR-associated protein Cas8c/Csd1 [Treponema sp.]
MSWITELAKVYDNTIHGDTIDDKPLPMFHTSNNASMTIVLDGDGRFVKAEKIDKKAEERVTVMPCTESCSNRTSGADAYPLCDKLEYVAEDNKKYNLYKGLLGAWAESEYATPKVKAVYSYVSARTLLSDLEKSKIGKAEISDFIRWEVQIPGDVNPCLWEDAETQESWILFYDSENFNEFCRSSFKKGDAEKRIRKEGLDYVSGNIAKIAMYHPSKIRNAGSSAKIISSNDTSNYTFRGRFLTDSEAVQISSETTQKAHSSLRWLIKRQGVSLGDGLSLVTWNAAGTKLPPITKSSTELLGFDFGFDETSKDEQDGIYSTAKEFAAAMNNRLRGYYGDVSNPQNIMVMAIKEATPGQGRVSIVLYRELLSTDLYDALNEWYNNLSWHVTCWSGGKKNTDKGKKSKPVHTIGTPSPKTITECAYGDRVKSNLIEKTVQRILPCILDGRMIPSDLERQCVKAASNLMVCEAYRRNTVLETACAVYKYNRKIKSKEEYDLALEENRTSRDYLYGRLLAVAHQEENAALRKMGESRDTNAIRYMQQFAMKPASTWKILYEKKLPAYKRHLDPGLKNWFEQKIQDITALFTTDDYISNKPLSGEYLLGYQCQLKEFRKNTDNSSENTEE